MLEILVCGWSCYPKLTNFKVVASSDEEVHSMHIYIKFTTPIILQTFVEFST